MLVTTNALPSFTTKWLAAMEIFEKGKKVERVKFSKI
jgi:hypothetical protein